MDLSLPKRRLLRKNCDYQRVYRQGQRLRGNGFTLVFTGNNLNHDRLGISVGGIKLAVGRNRIKRLIKEFYRHNRCFPSLVAGTIDTKKFDLIVSTYKQFNPQGIADITSVFTPYLKIKH